MLMTKKINNINIIKQEPEQMCEYCGKYAETRPYGPDGAKICFDCAMNSTPEMKKIVTKTFAESI